MTPSLCGSDRKLNPFWNLFLCQFLLLCLGITNKQSHQCVLIFSEGKGLREPFIERPHRGFILPWHTSTIPLPSSHFSRGRRSTFLYIHPLSLHPFCCLSPCETESVCVSFLLNRVSNLAQSVRTDRHWKTNSFEPTWSKKKCAC